MSAFSEYYLMWVLFALLALLMSALLLTLVPKKQVAIPVSLLSIALIFGMYLQLGGYIGLRDQYSFKAIDQTLFSLHQQSQLSKSQVIEAFQKLELNLPDSEKSWERLADIYQNLNLYAQAVDAYEHALSHKPAYPAYLIQQAYCQVMLADGKVEAQALAKIERVLQEISDHKGALNVLALYAYQQGDFARAIEVWEQILTSAQDVTDEEKGAILQVKAQALQKLGRTETSSTQQHLHLSLTVKLAAHLQQRFQPGQTLFVILKSQSGNPIPIAVKKAEIRSLPLHVTLTDADIMMQGEQLPELKNLKVIARISMSGLPTPTSGDLQGELLIDKLDLNDKSRQLEMQLEMNELLS